MNESISLNQIENFFLNSSVEISFSNFVFSILLSAALAFLVKFTYVRISKSLNDKEHFSEIFVPLAIITTLVITVVKFSLALSLGLVGALSIVRFRAAIKEPEELVYLFFIIGIGLANGANQFLVAIIATLLTLSILYVRKIYSSKKNLKSLSETSTNILQIQIENKSIQTSDLIDNLKKNVNYLNLKSFSSDHDSGQFNFWFDVDRDNTSNLISEIEKITTDNKDFKIKIFSKSGKNK